MLLPLTFILFASLACRAQDLQGGQTGTRFYIKGEEQGEIQGIRLFLGILVLKGIQLKFGESWSQYYGVKLPLLKTQELLLNPGEYVTAVKGSGNLCLRHLSFHTNLGRVATFGEPYGPRFSVQMPGQGLQTIYGVYKEALCLSGIGFKWREILKPQEPPKPEIGEEDTDDDEDDREEEDDKEEEEDKEEEDDKEEDDEEDENEEEEKEEEEEEEDNNNDDD